MAFALCSVEEGPVAQVSPRLYAEALEALQLEFGMKVLVVGSRSGYFASLCSEIGGEGR